MHRNGTFFHVGPLCGLVYPLGFSLGEIGKETGQGYLSFIEDEMIHLWIFLVMSRKERSTRNNRPPQGSGVGNYLPCRFLLDDHGTDEYVVGPEDVFILKGRRIQVDQSLSHVSGTSAAMVISPKGG